MRVGSTTGFRRRLLTLALLALATGSEGRSPSNDVQLSAGEQEQHVLLNFAGNISNWAEVKAARQLDGWAHCPSPNCIPVCLWGGVECDAYSPGAGNRVTSLSLSCEAPCVVPLRGRLVPGLETLQFLQSLDLSWNEVAGTLPPQWGANRTFPSLQVLNLEHNKLTGTIPTAWAYDGGFQEIVDFQVGSNLLTGSMPAVAYTNTSFMKMQSFNIGNNGFSGPLPEFWNGLIILTRVQIQNNRFTGSLPPDWGKQGYWYNGTINNTNVLESLYMHGNLLTGTLPAGYAAEGSFVALRELTLSGNRLSGALPAAWGNRTGALPLLRSLNLSDTGVAGAIPGWGPGLQSLQQIWLTGNSLTGAVPASWTQLSSLRRVVVAPGNPQLCTAVPHGARFSFCSADDLLCLSPAPVNASNCPGHDGSGSSFPVAAVVVPVAVVLTTSAAAAAVLGARRKRRRRAQAAAAAAADAGKLGSGPPAPVAFTPGPGFPPPQTQGWAAPSTGSHQAGSEGMAAAALAATSPDWGGGGGAPIPPSARSQQPHAEMTPVGSPTHKGGYGSFPGSFQALSTHPAHPWQPHPASGASSGSAPISGTTGTDGTAPPPGAATGGPPWRPQLPTQMSWDGAVAAVTAAYAAGARNSHSWSPQPQAGQHSWGAAPVAAAPGTLGAAQGWQGQPGGSQHGPGGAPQLYRQSWHPDVLPGGPDDVQQLLHPQLSDWEIDPDSITIARRPDGTPWRLGSGGFGTVYKAFRNGVTPVAVKALGTASDARSVMTNAEFLREIKVLRACRDTNILQFQGACFKNGETLLVTEYCEGGNLAHNLRARTVGWYRRGKKIALDVTRALVYLHSRKIVHLDIKSANVLLTRDGTAKVGDVGMAKVIAGDYVSGVVGTLAWSAPELLMGLRCTEKADVYSFGVVLWEIASGEVPTRGQMRELLVGEDCPLEVMGIVNRCLSSDPAARPSAVELVDLLQRAPAHPQPGVTPRVPAPGARRASIEPPSPAASRFGLAAGGYAASSAAASLGGRFGASADPGAAVSAAPSLMTSLDLRRVPSGGLAGASVAELASSASALPSGGPSRAASLSAALSPFASEMQQAVQLSVNTSPGSPSSHAASQANRHGSAAVDSNAVHTPAAAAAQQPAQARFSLDAPSSLSGGVSLPASGAGGVPSTADGAGLPPKRPVPAAAGSAGAAAPAAAPAAAAVPREEPAGADSTQQQQQPQQQRD